MIVRDVETAFLQKLGATRDDSGHHVFFYFEHGGSSYTVGKMSHSWRGALNDTQEMMLARKLNLRKQEFRDFVECTLSAAAMVALWQARRPR